MFVTEQKTSERWRQRGFSSAADARQARRSDYGTNSGRQRSRYHDEGPVAVMAPTVDDILRISRRTANEVRLFDIDQAVPVVIRTSVVELTITGAWTNGRGEWCYDVTHGYGQPYYRQSELVAQPLPASYVAEQVARERDAVNALKRGSRRRETRRIN